MIYTLAQPKCNYKIIVFLIGIQFLTLNKYHDSNIEIWNGFHLPWWVVRLSLIILFFYVSLQLTPFEQPNIPLLCSNLFLIEWSRDAITVTFKDWFIRKSDLMKDKEVIIIIDIKLFYLRDWRNLKFENRILITY